MRHARRPGAGRHTRRCGELHGRHQPPTGDRRHREARRRAARDRGGRATRRRAGVVHRRGGSRDDERAVHPHRRHAARQRGQGVQRCGRSVGGGRRQAHARRHHREGPADAAGGVGRRDPGAADAAHERHPRLQQVTRVPGGGRCLAGGRASARRPGCVRRRPTAVVPVGHQVPLLELREHPHRADGGRGRRHAVPRLADRACVHAARGSPVPASRPASRCQRRSRTGTSPTRPTPTKM